MLSDEDRRRLQDIEAAIRMEDPRFAERLADGRFPARAGRAVAFALILLGLLGLLAGLALLSGPMVLFAALVTAMGVTLWSRLGRRRRGAG
ncbi:DUF3040 domain-containing protein [Pseudonocardia lutea]|jgi:hypothetical protein|uniref:DUF3040 domain-containing protein n=1 Tax=Pseudonocardia lutea TaxID=2172015 RepID=A0ABW1I787_9PSEU